ncbi:MAG: hypothetical protein PWP04_1549 [Candidatus Atribacteria bacterium]|nr:hypothetical protein [Candidatus Atribacteria bacterium]
MGFSCRNSFSLKDISAYLCDDPLFLDNLAFFLNQQNGIRIAGKPTPLEEAHQPTKKIPRKWQFWEQSCSTKGMLYSPFSLRRSVPVESSCFFPERRKLFWDFSYY